MARKIKVCFAEEGPEAMPVELWAIAELLAGRRGEHLEDTLAAILRGLFREADSGRFNRSLAAQEAADRRYCQAEGISNVRDYSARQDWLELTAGLAELLAGLRAEPWRKDWPGLDM